MDEVVSLLNGKGHTLIESGGEVGRISNGFQKSPKCSFLLNCLLAMSNCVLVKSSFKFAGSKEQAAKLG